MTENPIYDVIDDELCRCLEKGARLPPMFSVRLPAPYFNALLQGCIRAGTYDKEFLLKLQSQKNGRITRAPFKIQGHQVMIRSEDDPDGGMDEYLPSLLGLNP